MNIFDQLVDRGHEQVMFWSEPAVGYRGIIAIHDTSLGPAMGGTRFWNYANDDEAVADAILLARAMTYKAAVAGLDVGGGKSVIIGDNRISAREPLFRAHGRAIQSLGGRYIAAEDVGTSVDDMEVVRTETEFVTGLPGRSGDPSPLTALGTLQGMRAAAMELYGDGSLDGAHVAVQGLGNVGYHLCELLAAEGARLTVTDIDQTRIERVTRLFSAEAVAPPDIYAVDADIFAPCALGAVINDETIPRLKVEIVAGAANNQLAETRHGDDLQQRGILYAPDYVGNAGGLINIYGELHDWPQARSREKVDQIFGTLCRVFELSRSENTTPGGAADRIAENRLAEAGSNSRPG